MFPGYIFIGLRTLDVKSLIVRLESTGGMLRAEGEGSHMGIESQYLGEINIPEEHRAEYAQQALKLLRAGGMVTVEPVQLYGHKLYLLSLPELDEEGKAVGHYNYLDKNGGERWCLNAKDGWFGCGKIIGSCYYSTVSAVHILTTLWSTSYAATLIDGCLEREKPISDGLTMCWAHNIRTIGRRSGGRSASCFRWTMVTGYIATRTLAICWKAIRQSARTATKRCLTWLPTTLTNCAVSSRPLQMKIGRSLSKAKCSLFKQSMINCSLLYGSIIKTVEHWRESKNS